MEIHHGKGRWILLGCIGFAVLALGCATTDTLLVTCGLLSAGLVVRFLRRRGDDGKVPLAAAAGLALVITPLWWSLLQLVPLPPEVLRRLSKQGAGYWRGLPGWHPISVDPSATRFAAATGFVVVAVYVLAVDECARERGRHGLTRGIATISAVASGVALLHRVLGVSRLYGFYKPLAGDGTWLGPLLNPNHAAALAGVGFALWAVAAIRAKTWPDRLQALGLAAFCAGCGVLTLSRMGVAVLGLEALLVAAYAVKRRGRRVGSWWSAAITAVVGAFVLAYRSELEAEFRDRAPTKVEAIRDAYRHVLEFAWVGAGRGAGSEVIGGSWLSTQPLTPTLGAVRFTHVEHWPAQWLLDLGIPIAVLSMAGAMAIAMWVARSRRANAGAGIALVALLVHDLGDFALELGGMAAIAAALFAIVVAPATRRRSQLSVKGAHVGTFAHGLLAIPLLFVVRGWLVDDDLANVQRAFVAKDPQGRLLAEAAHRRHPTESYFPLVIGAQTHPRASAGPWLVHAVQLGPLRAQNHFWLARWLSANGRSGAAWTEYALVLTLSDQWHESVFQDLLALRASDDDLLAVFRAIADRDRLAARLGSSGKLESAARIDQAILVAEPMHVPARVRTAERLWGLGDRVGARKIAALLLQQQTLPAYLLSARLAETPTEAEGFLVAGIEKLGDRAELLEELLRLRALRDGADAVTALALQTANSLVAAHRDPALVDEILAEAEVVRGRPALAISLLVKSADQSVGPEASRRLERAATLAEASKAYGMAVLVLTRLLALHPDRADFRARLAANQLAASTAVGGDANGAMK